MPTLPGTRVLIGLALLLGASLSWWLSKSINVETPPRPSKARHIPDYSMSHFTLRAMDDRGRLHYRLYAEQMSHFMDDDTSSLEQPNMTVFKPGGPSWNVYARHGWVSSGQKTIALRGDVVIWRNARQGGSGLEIQTDELHIVPDRQYAETDRPVTITQDVGVTHAVGMRVNLDQSRMELLADVRGHYVLEH